MNKICQTHFVRKGNRVIPPFPAGFRRLVVGTGCFWGSEKGFWRLPGVYSTSVGYAAGLTRDPTYEQVCSGKTGHNEVVQVIYDPNVIATWDLMRFFWESHDPTQGMGQGNDRGTQYRSGIYCTSHDQKKQITTEILMMDEKNPNNSNVDCKFYFAEDYHQQYLAKPGARPYCSAQPLGISLQSEEGEGPPKLSESFWDLHAPKPGCSVVSASNKPILFL
eukprot:GSMAST32.ASY1.ANO1.921.1 assembled CDS